ncbi:hypothetical protein GCM10027051_29020 [Niabella terrae]
MPSAQKQSNGQSKHSAAGSGNPLFDAFQPDAIINNAQQVLSSAVHVLEEEIAAGILAAKKLESKVIDVEDIREDPKDLMNRIRRDIHEAVDLLMDSVSALTRHFGTVSDNIMGKTSESTKPAATAPAGPTLIRHPQPAKPGSTVVLAMSLGNHQSEKALSVAFVKADLTGPNAAKIPARQLRFQPNPLVIQPGGEQPLELIIKVPKSTSPGLYSAMFTDSQDATNRLVVELEIA